MGPMTNMMQRSNITKHLKPISAEEVILGQDVTIEENVTIAGIDGPARKVLIGDNVFIGHDTTIMCPEIVVLDYTKIHNHTFIHGYRPCRIGYNCWIGQNTTLDSNGALAIGSNVGIGAYSQLWTHIKYGDVLEGCRYLSDKPLIVGNDVWFVGHCIVSPVAVEDKSMALVGSVIVKDMKHNHIYGGSPAVDLTARLGPPYRDVTLDEKVAYMNEKLSQFYQMHPDLPKDTIKLTTQDEYEEGITTFNVSGRTYTKRRTREEIEFMKFLLPGAKFVPANRIGA